MTRYYKSRNLNHPVVYVQEEGQWRGYAPGGVLQRSTGSIPEVILAQTVEITQDQAEMLLRIMRAETERIESQRAEAARVAGLPIQSSAPQAAVTPEAGPALQGPSSPPRSRRPSWLPYALAGGAAVIVVVVLVVLATTGGFWGGSGVPATQAGGAGAASTVAPGVLPAQVVATVGGRSITKEQLNRRVADFEAQYAGQIPDEKSAPDQYKLFQQDVLEYMITHELASQKAEQLNITVTDQDVQTQIDTILKGSYGGDQTKFDDALRQEGITMDQLKQTYKESMLFQKVYDEVTKGIVTVPDSDSTLLDAKRTEAWQKWIAQAKAESGVTYAEGWRPTVTTGTLLP